MKADEYQINGSHYKSKGLQHWSYCDANDVPYLESACSKYVLRWRDKNGLQDLEKALHYLEKRIENFTLGIGPVRGGRMNFMEYLSFVNGSGLDDRALELEIISHVMHWSCAAELETARLALVQLIEEAEQEDGGATSSYVKQD